MAACRVTFAGVAGVPWCRGAHNANFVILGTGPASVHMRQKHRCSFETLLSFNRFYFYNRFYTAVRVAETASRINVGYACDSPDRETARALRAVLLQYQ